MFEMGFLLTSRLLSNLYQSLNHNLKVFTALLRSLLAWYTCILPSPTSHTKHFSFLHHPFTSVQKAALNLLFCCQNTISHFQLPSFLPIHQNFSVYLILNSCSPRAFFGLTFNTISSCPVCFLIITLFTWCLCCLMPLSSFFFLCMKLHC